MDKLASAEPAAIWQKAIKKLEAELSSVSVDRWFRHLVPSELKNSDTLVIDVPDEFFRKWIQDHYVQHLSDALKSTGSPVTQFELRINPRRAQEQGAAPETRPLGPRPKARPEQELNARYTFDEFVVGPSNRFAHAASLAVSEQPAKAYNPLFIHGPVGMGKTHLMHAIGHESVRRAAGASVLYITSEKFTNELITAIQNRTTLKFREKFRNVDVLLIDDIHFIGGKEATQEEFFHTFNALYDSHKQIVVSSDRVPKDIDRLEERLVSRFEWGLVADIQPADFETRTAILRKKAVREKIQIPDPVTFFIAEKVCSNIRELEGALNRVVAFSHFTGAPITEKLAHEALKNFIQESERRVSVSSIQKRVAEKFNIKPSELVTRGRSKRVVLPRQVAMFLSRELTELSLPEIGQQFGGRDHTTVMYACGKIRGFLEKNSSIKGVVADIKKEFLT